MMAQTCKDDRTLYNRIDTAAHNQAASDTTRLAEFIAPPHFAGAQPHANRQTVEMYCVVEGSLLFQVGEDQMTVGAGDMIIILPGVVHSFINPSDTPAHFLTRISLFDFAGYYQERAGLIECGEVSADDARWFNQVIHHQQRRASVH
jgi:mannose-6-phosphate isomerase-like protein (cupin superfamily)